MCPQNYFEKNAKTIKLKKKKTNIKAFPIFGRLLGQNQ